MNKIFNLTIIAAFISVFSACATAPADNSQVEAQGKPPGIVSAESAIMTAPDAAGQALLDAAEECNTEEVKKLTAKGADVNVLTQDKSVLTPLMKAAEKGCYETAKALIDAGADVKKISRYGYTSLMFAAKGGNKELVKLLIEKGVDAAKVGHMWATALSWAADDEIAEILKKAGAK